MLNGIHIVDFGNHRNTRLTFGPMTALVGKNGAGKTTVMRAIGEVGAACNDRLKGLDTAFFRNRVLRSEISAGWTQEAKDSRIEWGLKISETQKWFRRNWPSHIHSAPWIPEVGEQSSGSKSEPLSLSEFVKSSLESRDGKSKKEPGELVTLDTIYGTDFHWACRYFKTSARALQHSALADEEEPMLNDDGSNLAWALAYLMTAEPDRFGRIVEALREVVPIVRRIRSRPVKLTRLERRIITVNKQERSFEEEREVMGQELIFDMMSGNGLPATSVSEGTLVVLAILTLVYGNEDVDLIMLDDVELGLHPKAQRDLLRQLRKIQEKRPQLQIIVSTHSPYVIDEFKPEEVWLFSTDSDGCAVSKRLSEHPDAKRGLEVLTTGEFWSAEGEGWVSGDEPSARVAEEPGL